MDEALYKPNKASTAWFWYFRSTETALKKIKKSKNSNRPLEALPQTLNYLFISGSSFHMAIFGGTRHMLTRGLLEFA